MEYLQLFLETDDPALFTTEVSDLLGVSQQGAYGRLKELHAKGYVGTKSTENARVWWITHAGRDYVMSQRD